MIDLEAIKRRVEAVETWVRSDDMPLGPDPIDISQRDVPELISEVEVLQAQVSATAQELGKAWVDLEKAWDALKGLRCRMLQDGPCWCEDGEQQWASWEHAPSCLNARVALLGPSPR